MSDPNPAAGETPTLAAADGQPGSKFVVFKSYRALLTLPNGTEYEFTQIRPHPIRQDPKDASSPITGYWYEGFATAMTTDRRNADKLIETAFAKDGSLPSHAPENVKNVRPLQLKLNPYPEDKKRSDGKSPDYIGTLLTSEGAFTVFARRMDVKQTDPGKDKKRSLLLAGSAAFHQVKPGAEAEGPREPERRTRAGAAPAEDPK
jgi:hypothetical protein